MGGIVAVQRLVQVFTVADDVQAAARFYAQGLGLEAAHQDGDRWLQFESGEVSFAIAQSAPELRMTAGITVPVFEVIGLQRQIAAAVDAGAAAGKIVEMGDRGRTVVLEAPGGARVSLIER